MPKLDAYETLVKYWQDKAKEEGLQKGEADLLIRLLTRRFGSLAKTTAKRCDRIYSE